MRLPTQTASHSTSGSGLCAGLCAQTRPDGAAINTTVGITLGELMIATRPTLAHWPLAALIGRSACRPSRPLPLVISVSPWLTQTSYGVSLLGSL